MAVTATLWSEHHRTSSFEIIANGFEDWEEERKNKNGSKELLISLMKQMNLYP